MQNPLNTMLWLLPGGSELIRRANCREKWRFFDSERLAKVFRCLMGPESGQGTRRPGLGLFRIFLSFLLGRERHP